MAAASSGLVTVCPVIAGPTAVGKTALVTALADRHSLVFADRLLERDGVGDAEGV